jgi:outer membrane protein assembly factor BamA
MARGEEARSPDAVDEQPQGWVALPGISYAPENGLSISAAAIHYWPPAAGSVQPSRVKFTTAVSERGSGDINVDPDIWFGRGQWNLAITSKLSDLERDFFGVGNDAKDEDIESYRAVRLEMRTEVARRLPHNLFIAGVYDFRYQSLSKVEEGGLIDTGAVPGTDSGLLSALGLELRYDSRDSTTFPTRGVNLESSPRFYTGLLGSDYQMLRWFTDISAFFEVRPGHVVAVDSKLELRYGDVPFDFMSDAGGKRLLRGLLQGRYRDTHYLAAQVEYRFPIYWRFRGVAFAGLGEVATGIRDFGFDNVRTSIGAGLRFALRPEQGIYLRLDAATAAGDTGAYLNLLEAF